MKEFIITIFYVLRALALVYKSGGRKQLIAENLLLRKQLILVNRCRKRAPNLSFADRLTLGYLCSFIKSFRLQRVAIIVKPSMLIKFYNALIKRKYSALFSNTNKSRSKPAGPSKELINAIVEMKTRNPRLGCLRIAMQINLAFGLNIDKNIVWRVLNKYYKPFSDDTGPSWLSFIANMKDSLWSVDFFRCESMLLKSHWVMIVMDQFTRKIIGFSVHSGDLHGIAVCVMFNKIISEKNSPKYLSSDNDPLFLFHRWRANLRILEIDELKSIPFTPTSHPFIERLIRTCRNELTDRIFFWNVTDLQRKLDHFKVYFNLNRAHMGIKGLTPNNISTKIISNVINLKCFQWKSHCKALFQLPNAA